MKNCNPTTGARPCAVDKLISYRKYGEITSLSKVSKYGSSITECRIGHSASEQVSSELHTI